MGECFEAWALFGLVAAFWAVLVLWMVRLHLVARCREFELGAVCRKADRAMADARPWRHYYSEFEAGPGWLRQIIDLRKWRHADFYPRRHD